MYTGTIVQAAEVGTTEVAVHSLLLVHQARRKSKEHYEVRLVVKILEPCQRPVENYL